MNAIVKAEGVHEIMENVLIKGDLSKLTAQERSSYYRAVCESVGLNALTKPFEYITLNGKLQLYALKACTDQLRSIYDISVTDLTKETIEGVHIVTAKVQNGKGRTDADIGAVNIANLKGEAFANAIMKASTKAKRRATLSICGLGMLDETEVEDIPRARVPSPTEVESTVTNLPQANATSIAPALKKPARKPKLLMPQANDTFQKWADRYIAAISGSQSIDELDQWDELNNSPLDKIEHGASGIYERIADVHSGIRTQLMRGSISTGPERSADIPNAEKDPDAFVVWSEKRLRTIAEHNDPSELTLIFENEVMAYADGLFKPDVDTITKLYHELLSKIVG